MDNDNLILQSLSGRRLSAAELVSETKIPSSTLYKRLARLKDDGLIEVFADPHDGRLKVYTRREAARPAVRRRGEAAPAPAAPERPAEPTATEAEPRKPEPREAELTGAQPTEAQSPETQSPETQSGEDQDQQEDRGQTPAPAVSTAPAAPQVLAPEPDRTAPAPDGPRALADAELDELAELLQRVDRLGLYRVPEYDALRRLLAREQAARGLPHSRAYA